ncbi:MAG: DUF2088 domain-containing protein [Lachnospiraceae bacterium]|nr:DUF2088 domain-containing protein [Lachnospiraceae bacterium]
MRECSYYWEGLSCEQALRSGTLRRALAEAFTGAEDWRRVLILGPDFSRRHSQAGNIVNLLYHRLAGCGCRVDILPALGTHAPMTRKECERMYGDIPAGCFRVHDWRRDVVSVGTVPAAFVAEVSGGVYREEIPAEVNRLLLAGYDQILSVGQVMPHEVVGMANHAKNIFVGTGGSAMIHASHAVGAFYGMERIMGRDFSPVRRIFDYAAEHFLKELPLTYLLTVVSQQEGKACLEGLFIGKERRRFEEAVALSQKKNIRYLNKPANKIVAWMEPEEYKSTWIANKAIYRSRMALADAGELIVLAPGVERFGEDQAIDKRIRRYGYRGRAYLLRQVERQAELRENLAAAAHLIHGSSDGRFTVTYCPGHLTREEIEGVGFRYAPLKEMRERYQPADRKTGWHRTGAGEEYYYIDAPGLGLWAWEGRMQDEVKEDCYEDTAERQI